ncbi:hypothetical protein GCM10010297_29630 [Streptomyces malachitofuscus]|nr:hypothetical protein GCM10010297_29630 [Streptomyces malachitofuscus]
MLIEIPPGPASVPQEYRATPGHPALAMTDTLSAAAVAVPPVSAHRRIPAPERPSVPPATVARGAARAPFVL